MSRRLNDQVAPSTIAYWKGRGAPIDKRYTADADKLEAWYRQWINRNQKPEKPSVAEAKAILQVQKLQEQLRRLRLDNDRKEGKLVDIADVKAERVEQAQIIRQAIDRMPDLLADQWQQVVDRESMRRIADIVRHDILRQLSEGANEASAT